MRAGALRVLLPEWAPPPADVYVVYLRQKNLSARIKAFTSYLGDDRVAWAAHDATELIKAGHRLPPLLIDQGLADKFLAEQLHPHHFEAACREAGQALTLRRHAGHDHGYYFIASFMEEHLRFHAAALNG